MRFPSLTPRPRSQEIMDAFGGYNHRQRIPEQDFYDLQNMTSHHYPVLATRNLRGLHAEAVHPQGMIARDSLCYVAGGDFVINGYHVPMGLSREQKQLVSMGAYVIILPDKKYINTADISDRGNIEAEFTAQSPVTAIPCQPDGTEYTPDYIQPGEPEAPGNMALWVDTSAQPYSLKQYSGSLSMWTAVENTYIKLRCSGIGKAFSQYDGVTLSGLEGTKLEKLNGSAILYGAEEDAVILPGLLETSLTLEAPLKLSRKMPLMDFVIESGNRLWGCRYGLNDRGQVVNELYASKLGDFKNWNCFLGISTDSYYVSLGSDGVFTGAVTHGGYPLFFRENCLHKVYGQMPANFSVQTTACRGVQKGCHGSLAIVNEILYYKSPQGVCAYDGAFPVEVSAALGDVPYGAAIGAGAGNRYYVSLLAEDGQRSLFVYDTQTSLWHRENDPGTRLLCACREDVYCAAEDGSIVTLLGSGDPWEKTLPWMLQTGILGGSLPEKKYLAQLSLRLRLELGGRVEIYAQYDSQGDWESLGTVTGRELHSFTVPVKPRRCDHLRLRLEGQGDCTLYSMTKTYAHAQR